MVEDVLSSPRSIVQHDMTECSDFNSGNGIGVTAEVIEEEWVARRHIFVKQLLDSGNCFSLASNINRTLVLREQCIKVCRCIVR